MPFKLYMALAAGKAIITQQDYSLPDDVPPIPAHCIPADAQALGLPTSLLATSTEQRRRLGNQAAKFYAEYPDSGVTPAVAMPCWQTDQ